ncbi:MAG TPA: DUF3073 family protein [Candidatus Nanopelagicales bacterium]|jgi:hypothetical protein|nr:DUF3073 family protein [Candidatus Nanopelagicales bacterium]
MGRGRAKAKQTKVARQLKYGSMPSDLGALQAELSTSGDLRPAPPQPPKAPEDDPYAAYQDDEDDEESAAR